MSLNLNFFRERGYQVLPGVIGAETARSLKSYLEGLVDVSLELVRPKLPFASREDFVTKVDEVCRSGHLEDYERETLSPLAQKKLSIDLDDGVKHNYPLFGNALKKVTGLS